MDVPATSDLTPTAASAGRSLSGAHPEYGGAARNLRGHLGDLAFRGGKVITESDDDRAEHVNLAQRLAGDIENAGERHGRLVATEVRRRPELGDGLGELQDVVGAFDPELGGALPSPREALSEARSIFLSERSPLAPTDLKSALTRLPPSTSRRTAYVCLALAMEAL